jgi:predicted transcriptional regulator
MNSAEVKLDLFRKIDSLDNNDLEKIYARLVELLNEASTDVTSLSPQVKAALDEALEASQAGKLLSHEEVMQKTREKYSRLFK